MDSTIPNSHVVIDFENHSNNTRNLKDNEKELYSVSKTSDLNLESTSNKPYVFGSGNIVPNSGVRTMTNSQTRVYCKSKTNSTIGLDLDKSESTDIICKHLIKNCLKILQNIGDRFKIAASDLEKIIDK